MSNINPLRLRGNAFFIFKLSHAINTLRKLKSNKNLIENLEIILEKCASQIITYVSLTTFIFTGIIEQFLQLQNYSRSISGFINISSKLIRQSNIIITKKEGSETVFFSLCAVSSIKRHIYDKLFVFSLLNHLI